ncbi:MAG: hypothetical protein AB7I42_27100 [Bradyrhizobium sp.]|jgi:hypothetical protein|uniref:hypothetical protein n=1 Tax=Bradyrhizobium sp. TaxID=376 RepID=UPI003D0DB9FD
MIIGTVEEAIAAGKRRRFDEGPFRGVADYLFESPPGEELRPQTLIARQAPGWTLPVHFHMQHQFQVVLRGSGTLGKHTLAPGSVHYTSPQSGYGPIVAGDDGLDYFTIRVLTDKGAWYLPDARSAMDKRLAKEQQWGALPGKPDTNAWQELIPLRSDGLGAWALAGTAGPVAREPSPASEAGRFYAVIRGAVRLGDRELPAGSCVYAEQADPAPVFQILEANTLLVAVQFPDAAIRHHVPVDRRMAPSARGVVVKDG